LSSYAGLDVTAIAIVNRAIVRIIPDELVRMANGTRGAAGMSTAGFAVMTAMQPHWKRVAGILLFLALAIMVVVRGVVPAVSRIDTDFPNYFTAARIVADRGSADRLYDDSWFQEQMRRYQIGKPANGKFAPFPPPTALLLVPLARLEPLGALRVMTGVSVLCLLGSIVLLARILSWSLLESSVFVLLAGYAIIGSLRYGQPYILVSLSCILGYYARLRGAPLLAGLCFGLFVPIKYFPVVILIYFAFRREWRVVLGGAAAAIAVIGVSIGVLGWKVHEVFLSSVLGHHLVADLSLQDPFTARFQSFDTLFRRLFIFDAASNPQPWLALPRLQLIGVALTKSVIFATALVTLIKLARGRSADKVATSVGILGILTLLLAPATASYQLVLLWLPVGLLIGSFYRGRARIYAYLMLGLYALIGFFPYGRAYRFEGRGGLTVLAYPRLFLLLAMFSVCVAFVWSQHKRSGGARELPAR
jgi:Glycosyltransferase family 87